MPQMTKIPVTKSKNTQNLTVQPSFVYAYFSELIKSEQFLKEVHSTMNIVTQENASVEIFIYKMFFLSFGQ